MRVRTLLSLITTVLVVGSIFVFGASVSNAAITQAAPSPAQQTQRSATTDTNPQELLAATAMANGQCGGRAGSINGFYQNLKNEGVLNQAARVFRKAGYRSEDGSLKSWMNKRLIITRLEKSVWIENYSCRDGVLKRIDGGKTLPKGHSIIAVIPLKYDKSDLSKTRKPGFRLVMVCVILVGQEDCSNPGFRVCVSIRIWVKVKKPTPKPKKRYNVYFKKVFEGGRYSKTVKIKSNLGGRTRTFQAKPGKLYRLGAAYTGTRASATELNIPTGWYPVGGRTRSVRVGRRSLTIVITNKKKEVQEEEDEAGKCNTGQIWDSEVMKCVRITQVNKCAPNIVINGDGNQVQTLVDCSTRVIVPPPDTPDFRCPKDAPKPWPICFPPPPAREISAQCIDLELTSSLMNSLTVDAAVRQTSTNTVLAAVIYDWGDGVVETFDSSGILASHTYARPGTYAVSVFLSYYGIDRSITSANCTGRTITPKDSTRAPRTDDPPGGPGSGGDPGDPDTGEICRVYPAGTIQVGTPDVGGWCI